MLASEVFFARCFSWFYKGSRYQCNLCGFKSRELRWRGHSFPILKEKNVISAGKRRSDCPHCLSSDRDRLVWLYLKNNLAQNKNILHVAPELPLANAIKDSSTLEPIEYTCIDKKTKGYYYPRWVQDGDITSLNFPDAHFDLIIANHVLEHIPNLTKALAELKRVLKPTGHAIFMVPLSGSHPTDDGCQLINDKIICALSENEKINRFGQKDHVRLFGNDIETIFDTHGWFISPQKPSDLVSDDILLESLALFPGECLLLAQPASLN